MLLRAVGAFLVLPGMVAFILPVWIGTSTARPVRYVGPAALLLCVGATLLLWCSA